jgi:hypothetical protein
MPGCWRAPLCVSTKAVLLEEMPAQIIKPTLQTQREVTGSSNLLSVYIKICFILNRFDGKRQLRIFFIE